MLFRNMASAYRAPCAIHYALTVYRVQRNTARRSIPVVRRVQLNLDHGRLGQRRCPSPGHVERYDITIRSEIRHGQGACIQYMSTPKLRGVTKRTASLRWTLRLGCSAHEHTIDSSFGNYLPPLSLSLLLAFLSPLPSS